MSIRIHPGAGAAIFLLLLLFPLAHAAGQVEGEKILDSSSNYQSNSYLSTIEKGLSYLPGGVLAAQAFSALTNSFTTQFQNKEQGLNQNTELDVAKQNLENSKDNVTTMFSFIVSTFIVLFDMILSIIYIAMLAVVIWIIFVGYAKFMILIIDFIHGKIKKQRGAS